MPISEIIGTWVAAALTLMVLSFLYRDNPFFRIAEHLYLGISNAYIIWLLWSTIVLPDFIYRVFLPRPGAAEWHPQFSFLIPGVLGIIMLTRMVPAISWLSRWALAFVVGWGAGVVIGPTLSSYILAQIFATFPWSNMQSIPEGASYFGSLINALLLFIGVVSVLVYFFFSIEHKGFIGKTAKLGVWVLMIAFGASFGSTVMARVSLFIGRARFLVQDAERVYHAFSILLTIGIIIALVSYLFTKKSGESEANT